MPLYELAPKSEIPRAVRQAPYDLLLVQLAEFLGQPGFEAACEQYLDVTCTAGTFSGLQDGTVWQNMLMPDGSLFFPRSRMEAAQQDELRLGVLCSCDWFNPSQSLVSESHSTGPLSLCVANLPPELR
jgi:hypothetical protein